MKVEQWWVKWDPCLLIALAVFGLFGLISRALDGLDWLLGKVQGDEYS